MKRKSTSRRNFLKRSAAAGMVFIGSSAYPLFGSGKPSAVRGEVKFEIGVASWGLRELSFDEVILAMKDMQLQNISLKSMHLPFELPREELHGRIERMKKEGLNPYAPGVVYMKNKEEADMAFEYTRNAGLGMIVGVPYYDVLDYVEEKIKSYDLPVAIHCHGPDNLPYPSPEDAYNRIKDRDPRLGICVDLAHVIRSGLDPVEQLLLVRDRLLDIHIWDVSEASREGKAVRPGNGVMDFEAILSTLINIGYAGSVSIEYGSEAENPVPAYIETKGYINGVLAAQ